MDQIKIGKFIAQSRKELGWTQRQLADELAISDKTVSKWETGKGLPEVALMMPLCEVLGISVNELLSGERFAESEFKERTERVIMDLVREREENKKKVVLAVVSAVVTVVATLTIILMAGLLQMEQWQRVLLTGIGLVVMLGGLFVSAALEWDAGTYECKHCKARFVPTMGAYMMGMHTLTTRHLRCPECGKKSWCKRRLTH